MTLAIDLRLIAKQARCENIAAVQLERTRKFPLGGDLTTEDFLIFNRLRKPLTALQAARVGGLGGPNHQRISSAYYGTLNA
jgi:hypothetical protein